MKSPDEFYEYVDDEGETVKIPEFIAFQFDPDFGKHLVNFVDLYLKCNSLFVAKRQYKITMNLTEDYLDAICYQAVIELSASGTIQALIDDHTEKYQFMLNREFGKYKEGKNNPLTVLEIMAKKEKLLGVGTKAAINIVLDQSKKQQVNIGYDKVIDKIKALPPNKRMELFQQMQMLKNVKDKEILELKDGE